MCICDFFFQVYVYFLLLLYNDLPIYVVLILFHLVKCVINKVILLYSLRYSHLIQSNIYAQCADDFIP